MTNDNFELEEMRQQMAILKQKLEQQEIINERMTSKAREALEKKVEQLTYGYRNKWVIAIVLAPMFYFAFVHRLGLSIPFWIFSSLYMPLRLLYFHRDSNKLCQKNLFDGNLVEVQKNLIMAKNHFTQGFWYDLILNIAWPAWFIWELYQKWYTVGPQSSEFGLLFIVLPFGIALFFWSYYHRKRQYQEALDQIADLTAGNEAGDN